MRKLVIPERVLTRHNDELGPTLLTYLEKLANGQKISWGKGDDKSYKAETPCVKTYWKWVYEQFRDKRILRAPPLMLLRFANENKRKLDEVGNSCGQNKKLKDGVVKISKALFCWDKFREGNVLTSVDGTLKIQWSSAKKKVGDRKGLSLAEFVRLLDVRYCPYCNAEIVGVVYPDNNNGKKSFSAIDHIIPKDDNPLLALSLYNLVPACFRCNSQFKGVKDSFDLKNWDRKNPPNALHLYAHDIHRWFRFCYKPSDVAHLFLKPQDLTSPLSAILKTPLDKNCPDNRKKDREFYLKRVRRHLAEYRLLHSYRDLYATEINEILKIEMICTPTFIEAMKKTYGMSDKDFNLAFRRTSLDPLEINKHRFGKLIIDLQKQIGYDDWPEEWETSHTVEALKKEIREVHQAAWEKRKRMIERKVRIKFSKTK